MRLRTFIMILLISAVSSHAGTDEDAQIKDTVLRYNQLLARGYFELNMASLKDVATKEQAEKEYIHMSSLGEANVRLLSELKALKFKGISFSGKHEASVTTEEVWNIKHLEIKTHKVVYVKEGVIYNLRYVLVKRSGRWIVSSVKER